MLLRLRHIPRQTYSPRSHSTPRLVSCFSSTASLTTNASASGTPSSLLSSSPLDQKPFYITTPIFYPNANPHIGHLYSLVAADVLARYQRVLKGRDVRFLAGTDEHGMKIQKAARAWAEQEGKESLFCDLLSARFKDLAKKANISNTCFMRTTSEKHHKAVVDVWTTLAEKGFIYKNQYSGWYSITDECFYSDAQVIPSPSPPPDQPDQKVSAETGSVVEWTSEENYMFRLSAFQEALKTHYASNPSAVYPPQYHDDVMGMLGSNTERGGLQDISISRPSSRLSWGIPVPGDPGHTVYVWFDALLIYLTGAGYPWPSPSSTSGTDSLSELQRVRGGWPADVQVIGKDILRFHAIYLPAILLALSEGKGGQGPALPSRLLAHAHWTVSQKKMSKSLGNVADPLEAMEKWGVDVVRFYLMRVGGRWKTDVDWSDEQLAKHALEIKGQLGNYLLRIASPRITKRAKTALEPQDSTSSSFMSDANASLWASTRALPGAVEEAMDSLEVAKALQDIISVLEEANKVFTTAEPWASDPSLTAETRRVGLEVLRVAGICLQPFIPDVSARMLDALKVPFAERTLGHAKIEAVEVPGDIDAVKLF